MASEGKKVGLGFLDTPDGGLTSRWFPSKAGGTPAPLERNVDSLVPNCKVCLSTLVFLCQVYAPGKGPDAFHRTVFVFGCKKEACARKTGSYRAFRSQLSRKNDYYSFDPPVENEDEDKKDKAAAKSLASTEGFDEFLLVVEDEPSAEEALANPKSSLDKKVASLVKKMEESKGEKGGESAESKEDAEFYSENEPETKADERFLEFEARVAREPEQVLRYARGSSEKEPLWATDFGVPSGDIPRCAKCGQEREFELQVMPQFLHEIDETSSRVGDMDFATVAVYTCKDDCALEGLYAEEYVFVQTWPTREEEEVLHEDTIEEQEEE